MIIEPALVTRGATERDLVAAVADGNRGAEALLYERALPALVRRCRGLLGPLCAEADDIAQDAFGAALAKVRAVGGHDVNFMAYAMTVARNDCVRFQAKSMRQVPFEAERCALEARVLEPPEEVEYTRALLQQVQSLPVDQREAVLTSPTVYAQAHGITPEAARQRRRQGRRSLRSKFDIVHARFSGVMAALSDGTVRLRALVQSAGGPEAGAGSMSPFVHAALGTVATLVLAVGVTAFERADPHAAPVQTVIEMVGDDGARLAVGTVDHDPAAVRVAGSARPEPGSSVPVNESAGQGQAPDAAGELTLGLPGDDTEGIAVALRPSPGTQEKAREKPIHLSLLTGPDMNGDGAEDPTVEIWADPGNTTGTPWPEALRIDTTQAGSGTLN